MDWWFVGTGENLLKGVKDDESNPIRLSDAVIVDFLRRLPDARESFNRIVPTMLREERDRLEALAAGPAKYLQPDYAAVEDDFQSRQNKAGVRTAGPRAGRRIGGNS